MMWRPRRPSDEQLRTLLPPARHDYLRYQPVGCSLSTGTPPRFTRRRWTGMLAGAHAFERSKTVLERWDVHRGARLSVVADGGLTVGTNVALAAPLPLGGITATCRIVAVVDEPDRHGFAYGTLGHHPEQGEESFVVRRGTGGTVTFEIVAVSRPRHLLARMFPPVADRLQADAAHRYLDAMRRAVAAVDPGPGRIG